MKYFLLLTTLMLSNSSYAWELVLKEDLVLLKDEKSQISEEVIASLQHKEIKTWSLNQDLLVISYLQSVGGTKYMSKSYNCALYSKSLKKLVLKDQLCQTIHLKEDKKEEIMAQFIVNKNQITYIYEELKQSFPLK